MHLVPRMKAHNKEKQWTQTESEDLAVEDKGSVNKYRTVLTVDSLSRDLQDEWHDLICPTRSRSC